MVHRLAGPRLVGLRITPTIRSKASAAWMLEAALQLPLVADLSQSFTLRWSQADIDLHPYGMDEESDESGHAEADLDGGAYLLDGGSAVVVDLVSMTS